MANWVKLEHRWINLDRVGSADDDGENIRLNADLDQGFGRISRTYVGADAAALRAALDYASANAAVGMPEANVGPAGARERQG